MSGSEIAERVRVSKQQEELQAGATGLQIQLGTESGSGSGGMV